MFKSLSECKKALNDKIVTRTSKARFCIGEEEAQKQAIYDLMIEEQKTDNFIKHFGHNASIEIIEEGDKFLAKVNDTKLSNFWLKPRESRVSTGLMIFRSKDFVYDNYLYGQDFTKANISLIPNGFETDYAKYELVK